MCVFILFIYIEFPTLFSCTYPQSLTLVINTWNQDIFINRVQNEATLNNTYNSASF